MYGFVQAANFLQADVAHEPASQVGIGQLMGMLREINTPRPSMLKNPCSPDMARTGCKDALCLKKHAEDLSGGCAELLLKAPRVPEPSPAPMVTRGSNRPLTDMISLLLGKDVEGPQAAPMPLKLSKPRLMMDDRRRTGQEPGMANGFFEMITTDGEGHTRTMNGPISATMPPELAMMMNMVPDVGSLLGDLSSLMPFVEQIERRSTGPSASIGDDPRDVAAARMMAREEKAARERYPTASIGGVSFHAAEEPQEDSTHPCDAEITHCQTLTGSTSSAAVKQCILQNFEKLSPKCKCFVHQVEGDRVLPSSAKAAPAPIVHAASAPDVIVTISEFDEPRFYRDGPPHFPCVLFTFLMFVGFAVALRRCLGCCCSRPTTSTLAVVVPPEHTTIKLVEPLMAVDIKTVAVSEKN